MGYCGHVSLVQLGLARLAGAKGFCGTEPCAAYLLVEQTLM